MGAFKVVKAQKCDHSLVFYIIEAQTQSISQNNALNMKSTISKSGHQCLMWEKYTRLHIDKR